METRPKMGEKNCTRAADERGRAGRALGGGDEETSSCAVGKLEAACAYERRAMQAGEQADRASQQMWCIREGHLVPPPSSAGRVCQAGACACARSRGAEESSRFHAVASSYTTYERRTTRENCARTGHCCRDTGLHGAVEVPRHLGRRDDQRAAIRGRSRSHSGDCSAYSEGEAKSTSQKRCPQ